MLSIRLIVLFALIFSACCPLDGHTQLIYANVSHAFAGVPWRVRISTKKKFARRHLRVEMNNARVVKDGIGNYLVYVDTPGKYQLIVARGTSQILVPVNFNEIPKPQPSVGNVSGGTMSRLMLRVQDGIIVRNLYLECEDGARSRVKRFTMLHIGVGCKKTIVENEGPVFNKTIRDVLAAAQPGDAVHFYSILVLQPFWKGTAQGVREIIVNDIPLLLK